jgi:hypothetical protein
MRPLSGCGVRHSARQHRLHLVEQFLGDQRFEVASLGANAVLWDIHDASVELVAQQHADRLRRERLAAPVREAPGSDLLEQLFLRESATGVLLERAPNQRRPHGIVYQALAHRPRRVQVADRGQEHPASQLQRGLHTRARSIRAHVVVELRKRGEDTLHQLASGSVVDRLGCGAKGDPQRLQMRPECEVVVVVPRETRQIEHNHEMDTALVQPAVSEQVLKLAAICRFGALAFLMEPLEDFVPLAAAVLLAGAKLRRQTEILSLLLRAHAHVDHRADHGWQRRSIRRLGQASFAGHSFYSEARHCSRYISTTMQAIVSAWRRMSSMS